MTPKLGSGYNSPRTLEAAAGLVALVNTRPHAQVGDSLAQPEVGEDVIRRFGGEPGRTDPAVLRQVAELRDALARALSNDASESERAWSDVSRLLRSATVRRVFTPAGVVLEPAEGDLLMSGIAQAVQDVVEADSWSRLRVCSSDLCELAFYDSTRSRTQKWDSYETCGNRANVAAHRARLHPRVEE
ncbi:MAG TPA: CGNR zinc finger domain-containing protein [Glaciibacter sp.]|nr:CGNR zinc finger domain-containing protein [Glaciibacter sp.]